MTDADDRCTDVCIREEIALKVTRKRQMTICLVVLVLLLCSYMQAIKGWTFAAGSTFKGAINERSGLSVEQGRQMGWV